LTAAGSRSNREKNPASGSVDDPSCPTMMVVMPWLTAARAVRIDESGRERQTARVDEAIGWRRREATDGINAIADEPHVGDPRGRAGAVEDARVADQRSPRRLLSACGHHERKRDNGNQTRKKLEDASRAHGRRYNMGRNL